MAVVLAILALALAFLAMPSGDSAATTRHHKPKPKPMYWGGWIGKQLTGTEAPTDMNAVAQFQNLIGKPLSLIEWAIPFENCNTSPCQFLPFPAENMQKVRDYGAIPFLSWSSASIPLTSENQPNYQLSDIINGNYDNYIAAFATQARDWGHPFFLRYDWEMTGNWFPWAEGVNGNQPGEYVAAWRHVHDIFTSVGATNATWVWCPLVDKRNTLARLRSNYPGNGYVDWTCLDGYNWGATPVNPHPWRSFNKIFKRDYAWVIKKIAKRKPMILAELGSNSAGGNKARWIRRMFKILPRDYRRVRGLIWFDQFDRAIDWPLETNPAAAAAFARGVSPLRFRTNTFSGLASSPVPVPRRGH